MTTQEMGASFLSCFFLCFLRVRTDVRRICTNKRTYRDPHVHGLACGEDAVGKEEVGERAVRDGGAAAGMRLCTWEGLMSQARCKNE